MIIKITFLLLFVNILGAQIPFLWLNPLYIIFMYTYLYA